ncbi:hypothetical protein FOC4_g10007276 [Fusarium odoratissimum]|uniref:Uncharacterized protein n=1 Tax=Fusarium oxysporum f. sp. cubense (strain race 4) TaxID=2502994 RepID=N1RDE6_FUSC4|nr:hypothetical protein FOC4_g10007276 [Fusarium odoratissimum]
MQNDMMLSSSTDEQLENERKERRMDERRRVGKEEEEVSESGARRERHRSNGTGTGTSTKDTLESRYLEWDTDGARWSDTRLNHWIGGQTLAHFQTPSKVFSKRD